MGKFLLVTSIPWCLIALVGVVVAFKDKQYQNRDINFNRLGKQYLFSAFLMVYSLSNGAWLAAGIWGASILLLSLAIYLSGRNRKKLLSSMG